MPKIFTALHTGSQEVPPNASTASGAGVFVFNEANNTGLYQFTVRGVDFGLTIGTVPETATTADNVVSMHFHNGARGVNGPVVFGQINPAQDNDDLRISAVQPNGSRIIVGNWEPSDPASTSINNFAATLNAAAFGTDVPLYHNIHTTTFPGGEIRGQLVTLGTVGRDIRSGVDVEFYLAANPDVRAAGVDPVLHFNTLGWREGRDPNALFDTSDYLSVYADVRAAGVNPLGHYNTTGFREGRDPSKWFDTVDYLTNFADVRTAGANPLEHYLQFGINEGRFPFADGVFG